MPTDPPPSAEEHSSTACIILAAGGSKRLGQAKQLLKIEGSPLLARTVETALATPSLWPVIVVIGAEASVIRPTLVRYPVLITENPAWTEGVASSLRAGLSTLTQFSPQISQVLISLCDQPALTPEMLQQLMVKKRELNSDLVAAAYDGHPGAPAVFDQKYFATLAQLTGDEGARTLFKSLAPSAITTVDLPELSLDIDTPADYQRATGQSI